jgi:Protein of unknown function DUF262/Protein of unknown function (DUF1524)
VPSELQNLDSFFNSRLFRIPDYQRGYAWEVRQLKDFWQDLDRLRDQRNHYTGQVTMEKVSDGYWRRWEDEKWLIEGKGYKPFYVVDGQQRLTSAIILIKCLLERIPDGEQLAFTEKSDHIKKYLLQTAGAVSRAYLFGYEKDNPSYEYLKTQILGETSNQSQGIETTYTANLRGARDFFREKMKDASRDDLERLFKALTQRFLFNVYELEGELDVFVVFETMNNRGKPLSRLELLKNRLIYLSTLFPVSTTGADLATLRRNVNDAWKTVYEYLGREKDYALDDDKFLRAHWIMYFTYSREEEDQFASFLLDQHFTTERTNSGSLTVGDLQDYVTSVQNSVRKWHTINFPSRANELPEDVRRSLERLDRLGRGAFEPLIMAALQKRLPNAEVVALLDAAERFVFLVARLCQRRSNTGDSEFYRVASQLFRGEKTLAEVTQIIRERTDHYFSVEKAVSEMRDLFLRGDGFYSWSGLRYFLFEYEQYLKAKAGMGTARLAWHDFIASKKDYVTVEHIYPQSATSGVSAADWATFKAKPKKEREILLHSLGNLLALSQSRNSKFSNRAFSKKKQDEDGIRGYFNGSYSEIKVAQFSDWTPECVLNRGLEMLSFLEERWGISLGPREEKLKLLNLDSLEPLPTTADA